MLSKVLSEKALAEAAGKAAFARGEAYFHQGRVVELAATDHELPAPVGLRQDSSKGEAMLRHNALRATLHVLAGTAIVPFGTTVLAACRTWTTRRIGVEVGI